jgi:hypothetical protein
MAITMDVATAAVTMDSTTMAAVEMVWDTAAELAAAATVADLATGTPTTTTLMVLTVALDTAEAITVTTAWIHPTWKTGPRVQQTGQIHSR